MIHMLSAKYHLNTVLAWPSCVSFRITIGWTDSVVLTIVYISIGSFDCVSWQRHCKLQASVYHILPPTAAITGYARGPTGHVGT